MFCLYCGTEIPDDAVFCHSCGKRQSEQPPAENVPKVQGTAHMSGEPTVERAPLAAGSIPAGQSIPDSEGKSRNTPPGTPKRTSGLTGPIVLIILLLVLLLVAGGIGAYLYIGLTHAPSSSGTDKRLQYDANPTDVQSVVRQFCTNVGAGQWQDASPLLTGLAEHYAEQQGGLQYVMTHNDQHNPNVSYSGCQLQSDPKITPPSPDHQEVASDATDASAIQSIQWEYSDGTGANGEFLLWYEFDQWKIEGIKINDETIL